MREHEKLEILALNSEKRKLNHNNIISNLFLVFFYTNFKNYF